MAQEMKILGDEYPELYHHLAAIVLQVCEARGMDTETASSAARDFAHHFRTHFGGDSLYIPKVAGVIHEEIYRRWNAGADSHTLAREYDYSVPHINAIVREMKAQRRRQQKGLFDGLDPTP